MSAEKPYLVFGSDNSPYSIKVRAYFAFKGVSFRWIVRSPSNEAEYRKVARLAIVPAVRLPSGKGMFLSRLEFFVREGAQFRRTCWRNVPVQEDLYLETTPAFVNQRPSPRTFGHFPFDSIQQACRTPPR